MKATKSGKALLQRGVLVAALCILLLGLAPVASAQSPPWPTDLCIATGVGGGEEVEKTLTCFPPDDTWNGVLVVYAHGYVDPNEPLQLPIAELSRATLPDGSTLIGFLVSHGFAFATTSYSKNGYAIEAAQEDLNRLVGGIQSTLEGKGAPAATAVLVGASEGGVITVQQLERFPDTYQGGLAMCGPIGGMPYQVQYLGDFRAVFDVLFPRIFNFGVIDVPTGAYEEWDSVYAPAIDEAIRTHPVLTNQLFRVTDAARIPWQPDTSVESAQQVLRYSVFATNDLMATAGGNPYGNEDVWYSGSLSDRILNRRVERVSADPAAQGYVKDYYQPTGNLVVPLVTLHTLLDPQVPFRHELMYRDLAKDSGKLTVLPVPRYGHCEFTAGEVLGAFGLVLLQMKAEASSTLAPQMQSLPAPMN